MRTPYLPNALAKAGQVNRLMGNDISARDVEPLSGHLWAITVRKKT